MGMRAHMVFVLMFLLSSMVGMRFNVPVRATPTSTAVIDLFTQKGGKGSNQSSGSFSPQEVVILYAYVTWNGAPVRHMLVGFEVFDPFNRCLCYRTAETNASGLATTWFRILDTTDYPEFLGMWTAIAKAEIADEKVEDTLTFMVLMHARATNLLDLILVIVNLGPVPPKPPECDVNGDGAVDIADIILVLIDLGSSS